MGDPNLGWSTNQLLRDQLGSFRFSGTVMKFHAPRHERCKSFEHVWANYSDLSRGHLILNGGSVRESPAKSPKHSGLGIILICPEHVSTKGLLYHSSFMTSIRQVQAVHFLFQRTDLVFFPKSFWAKCFWKTLSVVEALSLVANQRVLPAHLNRTVFWQPRSSNPMSISMVIACSLITFWISSISPSLTLWIQSYLLRRYKLPPQKGTRVPCNNQSSGSERIHGVMFSRYTL